MKIEKLMPYKLKICITEEDLDDWQLRQEDITKNTSRTREMFVYILKTAKRETGFYFENSRLIIENLKKENNVITMLLTRVDTAKSESGQAAARNEKMMCFENFDDMVLMAQQLSEISATNLYEYDGCYYLSYIAAGKNKMCEFGKNVSGAKMAMIEEHSRKIVGGDVISIIKRSFG